MRPYILAIVAIGIAGFTCILGYFAHAGGVPVLMPSGAIGAAERDLMVHAIFLMLIVVVPVFILIIFIAIRYRATNTNAAYTPDWEHSTMEEFIWWVIPFEIVLVLAALTWGSTHTLDPMRPIVSTEAPLTVQVVALPWKWLFIYPEEGVASVNELAIPTNRPVKFEITADAPMNSFWIPALGGQMYAMTGMVTELNLIASTPGDYPGRSANYSGEGFADMTFIAHALSSEDFDAWVAQAHASDALSHDAYAALAKPGAAGPVRYYGSIDMPFMEIVDGSMGMQTHSPMQGMTMPDMRMNTMDMTHH